MKSQLNEQKIWLEKAHGDEIEKLLQNVKYNPVCLCHTLLDLLYVGIRVMYEHFLQSSFTFGSVPFLLHVWLCMYVAHVCVIVNISTFHVRRSRGKMYRGHGRLCVCLSLAAFPHCCMDPDVTGGMVGVPSSCAVLARFAISAWVSLL